MYAFYETLEKKKPIQVKSKEKKYQNILDDLQKKLCIANLRESC